MPKTPTYFFPMQFNLRASLLSTYHQTAGKRSLNPPYRCDYFARAIRSESSTNTYS